MRLILKIDIDNKLISNLNNTCNKLDAYGIHVIPYVLVTTFLELLIDKKSLIRKGYESIYDAVEATMDILVEDILNSTDEHTNLPTDIINEIHNNFNIIFNNPIFTNSMAAIIKDIGNKDLTNNITIIEKMKDSILIKLEVDDDNI